VEGIRMRVVPQVDRRWWGQLEQQQASPRPADDGAFKARFYSALSEVNRAQLEADHAAERLTTGEANDLSEVMISSEKARLALLLATRIRSQAIDAYREIMRMQI